MIPKDSDWEIVSELGQFGVLPAAGKRGEVIGESSAARERGILKSDVGE